MEYANRKYPRLKHYDYRLPGYYYVTIHMSENTQALSSVTQVPEPGCAAIQLTAVGEIAQAQLLELESRYPFVRIDKYVIMPTHIHAIIQLIAGELPRADLPAIVGAYKSLTTIAINKSLHTQGKKWFQRSFYDTVLRNETAYQECWQYIDRNPAKWIETNL